MAEISGKYFVDCDIQEREANPVSRNMELSAKLWRVSEELTGLRVPGQDDDDDGTEGVINSDGAEVTSACEDKDLSAKKSE